MENLFFNVAHAQNRNGQPVTALDQIAPQQALQGAGEPLSVVLNQLFYAGLAVAVVLALYSLVRAAVQYMSSDSGDSKSRAKARVQAAVGGLVLAFGSVLILNSINPSLTNLTLRYKKIDPVESSGLGLQGAPVSTGNGSPVTSGTRPDGTPVGTGDANTVVKGNFSHITATDLRPYLGNGYSAADLQAFIDAGNQYGIDPRFLAAISKFETDNGTSKAFTDGRNNAMGISNNKGPVGFDSVRDSIFAQANSLTKSGGHYVNANTIQQIGNIYSPAINPATGKPYPNDIYGTNGSWVQSVTSNYNEMTRGNGGN